MFGREVYRNDDPPDYDQPVVLSDRRMKARKAHTCSHCSGTIEPGATYTRIVYLDDDTRTLRTQRAHFQPACPNPYPDEPAYTHDDLPY